MEYHVIIWDTIHTYGMIHKEYRKWADINDHI